MAKRSLPALLGSVALTAFLGAGLVASTRLAEADTGASSSSGDLANILEEKLHEARGLRSGESASPNTAAAAPQSAAVEDPTETAGTLAVAGLGVAAVIFVIALYVKRAREGRMGDALGSNLSVKESVWIGRGQRILLLAFENHKVLVGVSGGSLHNLGIFGEEGDATPPLSPIERAAAMKGAEQPNTSEFADFVKGELAGSLASAPGVNQDRRRKMISELNTL